MEDYKTQGLLVPCTSQINTCILRWENLSIDGKGFPGPLSNEQHSYPLTMLFLILIN